MYIQYVQYAMPISREEKDTFTFYMPADTWRVSKESVNKLYQGRGTRGLAKKKCSLCIFNIISFLFHAFCTTYVYVSLSVTNNKSLLSESMSVM